jgi:hypothetical protein
MGRNLPAGHNNGGIKMIKRLRTLGAIAMVMFCAGIASADIGTFYDNSEAYHGPIYTAPDGSTTAGCYNNSNWRVYESDHFLIYSDISSDAIRIKLAQMAETEFATVKSVLGVTDTELGINPAEPSTKLHICSDGVGTTATGGFTGVSMPALDGANVPGICPTATPVTAKPLGMRWSTSSTVYLHRIT